METFSALLAYCAVIHRSLVNSPHKGQWRGALMFSMICAWTNGWANSGDDGELRHYRAHYDVIVMKTYFLPVLWVLQISDGQRDFEESRTTSRLNLLPPFSGVVLYFFIILYLYSFIIISLATLLHSRLFYFNRFPITILAWAYSSLSEANTIDNMNVTWNPKAHPWKMVSNSSSLSKHYIALTVLAVQSWLRYGCVIIEFMKNGNFRRCKITLVRRSIIPNGSLGPVSI